MHQRRGRAPSGGDRRQGSGPPMALLLALIVLLLLLRLLRLLGEEAQPFL